MTVRPLARVAGVVATRPRRVLAVAFGLVVLCGVLARDVRLDNNFAQLFSTKTEDARFREEYRRTFGPDDGLLVAVLRTDQPGAAFQRLVRDTSDAVRAALPELQRVNSAATVPADLAAGTLISDDGRTALVVGELAARFDSYELVTGPAERFESTVRGVVASAPGAASAHELHFAGVTYTRIAAIGQMQGDLVKLFPVATLAMVLLLFAFFRRPVAVVAPLLAITASCAATAAVVGLAGDDLNQITIIAPVLLMGVVVATATHLIHRFYCERAAGADAETAARVTLERIGRAAVVCTLTNAIGFASLLTSKMQILHEFGFYLACGIVFCFVATSTIVPALLVVRDSQPPRRYLHVDGAPPVVAAPRARRFATAVTSPRASRAVLVGGLALVGASIAVASTATFDDSLSAMLNDDQAVSAGNRIIDRDLSGIVPIEISVRGAAGAFDRPDQLARLDAFDAWLRTVEGLRPVGLPALWRTAGVMASDPASVGAGYRTVASLTGPGFLDTVVTADHAQARLAAFHPDTGARAITALARRIDDHARSALAGTGLSVKVTGEAPVAYTGMLDLTRELVVATLVALVLIVVAIGIAYRSAALALVAVLPNVVPIVVGLALYRLTKATISPVPAVVFCIAMGLAADDTVHLMNRFRELRPSHPDGRSALVEALCTVRTAMVSSSAVLIAAFAALGISNFPANRTLGVLGSLVLVLALGSDLLFGTAGLAVLARRRDRRGRDAAGRRDHGDSDHGDSVHLPTTIAVPHDASVLEGAR